MTLVDRAETHGAERGLRRLEAFSDAVFAIALTLPIVETKPPGAPAGPRVGASLLRAIAGQWRDQLALLLSFLAIGVYWLQHHNSGRIFVKSDYAFGVINLGFLLAVTALPYPLRLWCYHFGTVHERAASIVLTIALLMPPLFWLVKWVYAMGGLRLMDERLAPDFIFQMTRRYAIATGLHAAAVPIAVVAPRLGVALALGVITSFLVPLPKPRYKPGQEPEEREVSTE